MLDLCIAWHSFKNILNSKAVEEKNTQKKVINHPKTGTCKRSSHNTLEPPCSLRSRQVLSFVALALRCSTTGEWHPLERELLA